MSLVLSDFNMFLILAVYGTRHVLVLADFPPSTRTTDLEKLLEKFKDRFVIRWVNDTTSLAIFRTSSVGNAIAYLRLLVLFNEIMKRMITLLSC